MTKAEYAAELFSKDYNCAQAVAMAFAPEMGISEEAAAKMVSSFGGGMGRMREVCGAVSGMLFALGTLYGYTEDVDGAKMEHYKLVQELAGKFREINGSIVCRDILKNPPSDPVPSPRTEEYYASRPCVRMVYTAASILEEYISANPPKKDN